MASRKMRPRGMMNLIVIEVSTVERFVVDVGGKAVYWQTRASFKQHL